MDMQKTQGDTQLDLLLQHLPPQLQVLRSSTARSWGEMPEPWRGSLDEPPEGNKLYIIFNCLLSWSFFNLQIGKTGVASLYLICSKLEFDGYVFDRLAMLACDLAASLNHHFKKARFFCTDKSKLTSLSMSFPALFKI